MNEQLPSPQTTLLILLGASQWPYDPIEFQSDEAFEQAAEKIEKYFTNSFGMPKENVLSLFDKDLNAIEIGKEIHKYLANFKKNARDVFIYYVGHAKRTRKHNQLYLAIKDTQKHDPEGTSLKIDSLAKAVQMQACSLRRFYILDCCFAATAIPDLQGPSEIDLLHDTFEEVENETQRYAALFSSSSSEPSIILPDHTNTFFTEGLLQVLSAGNPHSNGSLSFKDVYEAINPRLKTLYTQYHSSHSQTKRPPYVQIYPGNIAKIPIFPNPVVLAHPQNVLRTLSGTPLHPIATQPPQQDRTFRDELSWKAPQLLDETASRSKEGLKSGGEDKSLLGKADLNYSPYFPQPKKNNIFYSRITLSIFLIMSLPLSLATHLPANITNNSGYAILSIIGIIIILFFIIAWIRLIIYAKRRNQRRWLIVFLFAPLLSAPLPSPLNVLFIVPFLIYLIRDPQ